MAYAGAPRRLPHLLVFPFPAQGHLLPLLDLARLLSSRSGFRLTVVVTPANLPLLRPFLSSAGPSAADPLVLPLPSHPSLPSGVEHVRDLPDPNFVAALVRSLSLLRPQIIRWCRSQPDPPVAIISDFFLGWTHHLAAELGVPRIAFYSSGAFAVSVIDEVFLRPPRPDDAAAAFPSLPTSPSFPYAQLPSLFRRYMANSGDPDWGLVRESFLANAAAWGAVFNTFDALEGPHLAHLKKAYGHERVWAVGPLAGAGGGEGPREALAGEVAAWLSARPPRSVVYVCFGSQFTAAEQVIRPVAAALELSGARFIWAVGKAAVPEGFEDRTSGRGLVVKGWAPQVAILGHGSVGSFVTHCGWNSVLEAASAGVAMLAWPMEAEQFVNARLLVEELGVAVRVGEGHDRAPDPGELARAVAESVAEGAWPEVRARAVELARRAAEAVMEGGSSVKQLEELVIKLREE